MRFFHSGYWERGWLLAPCQPRGVTPRLLFRLPLVLSSHPRAHWSQPKTRGTLQQSSPQNCPPHCSRLVSSHPQQRRPDSGRPRGSAGLLPTVLGAGNTPPPRQRAVGGRWAGLIAPLLSQTTVLYLVSYVQRLKKCCFMCWFFRCFRWEGKSGPCCSILTRNGCLPSLWCYEMVWII